MKDADMPVGVMWDSLVSMQEDPVCQVDKVMGFEERCVAKEPKRLEGVNA